LTVGCSSGNFGPSTIPTQGQPSQGGAAGVGPLGIQSIEKELGNASAFHFAVLGLGSPTNVSITGPSKILGLHDVGVAGASKFSMSDGVIQQRLVLSSLATTNISGPSQIQGGIVVDDSLLSSAVTDANNASNLFAGLPASPGTPTNINISNPSGNVTINATGYTTVVNLKDLVLNGGSTVTLSAPKPAWQFVVNVTGNFAIQGSSRVVTAGIAPPHVVFNVLGSGSAVAMGGGTHNGVPNSQVSGVILALQRNIALSPGLVRPEVIGGGSQITITSGGIVLNQDR
jgi:hypothetical protein